MLVKLTTGVRFSLQRIRRKVGTQSTDLSQKSERNRNLESKSGPTTKMK